jgi:hypothetical protein
MTSVFRVARPALLFYSTDFQGSAPCIRVEACTPQYDVQGDTRTTKATQIYLIAIQELISLSWHCSCACSRPKLAARRVAANAQAKQHDQPCYYTEYCSLSNAHAPMDHVVTFHEVSMNCSRDWSVKVQSPERCSQGFGEWFILR